MAVITQRGRASLWGLEELGADPDAWLRSPLDAGGVAGLDAPAVVSQPGSAAFDMQPTSPAAGGSTPPITAMVGGKPIVCDGWTITDVALLRFAQRLSSPGALCGALTLSAAERAHAEPAGLQMAVASCSRREGQVCVGGRTTLWGVVDGRLVEQYSVESPAQVTALAVAPGGGRIAIASCDSPDPQECNDAQLELFDVAAGGVTRRTEVQGGRPIHALAFRGDGRLLAMGSCARLEDTGAVRGCALGAIRLLPLDPSAGLTERTLTAHAASVTALAFGHDGRWLVSGGADESLALWELPRGARIGPVVRGIAGAAGSLQFVAPDRLVTWHEGQLRTWHASAARWSSLACGIANRRLSDAEQSRFLPGEPLRDACADGLPPRGSALWRWVKEIAA
jgi:hypothetical protein